MPDTETVKYTTVSLGFDIEVSDSFGGYGRLLHLNVTIRTIAFSHWFHIRFRCRLINMSGHSFTRSQ